LSGIVLKIQQRRNVDVTLRQFITSASSFPTSRLPARSTPTRLPNGVVEAQLGIAYGKDRERAIAAVARALADLDGAAIATAPI